MTSDVRSYPSYKSSGIEWIADVPTPWQVRRIKSVSDIRYGLGQPPREAPGGLPLIRATNIERGRIVEKDMLYVDPADVPVSRDAILRAGEIIVVRSGAYTADSAIVPEEYAGSVSGYDMVVTVKEEALPKFVALALLSTYLRDHQLIVASTRSAQPHLNAEELGTAVLLLPPISEQTAIVRYLDHADSRIQCYISAKERLIELLTEQKQAIINQAVTRGLDPNVPLKSSGVEWLGDVPAHWDVIQLGRLVDLATGFAFKSERFSFGPDDIRLLRGINVSPGRLRWRDVVRWPKDDCSTFGNYRMEVGDIVLGMDRPLIEGGVRVASVSEDDVPALLLQRVARIRPRQGLSPTFTLLLLSGKNFADYLAPIFTGISVPHVSPEQIKSYRIALPSLWEQSEIVDHVTTASDSIQVRIDRARRQIELMQEYRTRLIADVVTGKLDVRGAVAEEIEVPTP